MFRLKTTKQLVLAVIDFIIIGVIIYGLGNWVYDGYPSWVPYAIMVFFLVMASIRFYKFSSELKKSNSLDSRNLESLFADDPEEKSDSESLSPNGFRRRSKASHNESTESSDN